MRLDLEALTWPAAQLGEALEALARAAAAGGRSPDAARAAGVPPRAAPSPRPAWIDPRDPHALAAWIDHAAAQLGIEAEPASAPHGELLRAIRNAGPALLQAPPAAEPASSSGGPAGDVPLPSPSPRFFAIARNGGARLVLLAPDGTPVRVSARALADLFTTALEAPVAPEVDDLLTRAGASGSRRIRARRALLDERLGATSVDGLWLLRLAPSAPFWRHALHARLPRRALTVLAAYAASFTLWILAWWIAGRGVLEDRLDPGWLAGWAIVLLAVAALRLLATWSAGLFALEAGALLKQRLLVGALALEPQEIRRDGAGRMLGRVIESESVESLSLGGGLAAITSTLELLVSAAVLARGAAGAVHTALLGACVIAAAALTARHLRARRRFTEARLAMTHDLVERMVGHRTRLAQEPRAEQHIAEDEALARTHEASLALDRSQVRLASVLPGVWLLAAVIGLVPAFLSGTVPVSSMAVALGGALLARGALKGLVTGLANVTGAAVAFQQIAPLFRAAERVEPPPAVVPPRLPAELLDPARTLLEAHDIHFRHAGRARPIVNGATLRIAATDRILLEGPSGGGKSTFSALLSGLRAPESGLLLLDGFDRATLGAAGWRRRVAAAPQFHENHILTGSFAFNLLVSRRWPPTPLDLADAEAICDELGLGDLLARMPSGLEQIVGETGWQLSHGEKSRLHLARALLQNADIAVLDETFAALDPETLQRALECVLARNKAVVVVAHP